jgi:hypothetical protein
MDFNTNIEPVRRNGTRESRKDTLYFHELMAAIVAVEKLADQLDTDVTSLENVDLDMTTGLETAMIVTDRR